MQTDFFQSLIQAQISIWLVAAAVGAVVLIARAAAQRLMREIDARFERIDALSREVSRVDGDLKRLLAELPIHYQRRDDAIREYTAVNAKLDRIWETIIEARRGH